MVRRRRRHGESSLVSAIRTFDVGLWQSEASLFCCQIRSHLRGGLRLRPSNVRAYVPALFMPRPLKIGSFAPVSPLGFFKYGFFFHPESFTLNPISRYMSRQDKHSLVGHQCDSADEGRVLCEPGTGAVTQEKNSGNICRAIDCVLKHFNPQNYCE